MDRVTKLLVETARSLFAEGCEHELQESVENGEFPDGLWTSIEDNGLTRALVAEADEGVGLDLDATCSVLRVAGAFALPVPLADTIVAATVLSRAGIDIPDGPMVVAPVDGRPSLSYEDGRFSGRTGGLPWIRGTGHVVLLGSGGSGSLQVGAVSVAELEGAVDEIADAAGAPWAHRLELDRLDGGGVTAEAGPVDDEALSWCRHVGALTRISMIAGALDRILDLCIEHATEREQFGRPVAKFQLVQNHIAVIAGEAAAVGVAAPAAVRAYQEHGDEVPVAAAKTRAGEAAARVARIAHQVHAAMGFTREHILHRFTRRLWAWRDHYGSEREWSLKIGDMAVEAGGDGLWPRLTANG